MRTGSTIEHWVASDGKVHARATGPVPGFRTPRPQLAAAELLRPLAAPTLLDVPTMPGPQPDDEAWMSTRDAARDLGITPRALYRLIDRGVLMAYRWGRVVRVLRVDVEAYKRRN